MARRPKRQKGGGILNAIYIASGVALFASVVGISGYLLWIKPEKIPRDAETLCPLAGPKAYTAIIVDRTDSFGTISKADIEVQLRDLFIQTRADEEISLYTVEPIEGSPLKPLTKVCNPGNPNDADPMISSKAIVEQKFKAKFERPLSILLSDLLTLKKSQVSPIMESVQSVSIADLSGSLKSAHPRRIVLVSDLLQNSKAWSLYTQSADYSEFSKSLATKGLNPDLRGVSVELLLLQRQMKRPIPEPTILRLWKHWIEANGGEVGRILRVSGMNE